MLPSFLICGPEHSGTTLLSDIFRQTSKFESGFECGVLLAKSPKEFRNLEPFVSNISRGWMISSNSLDYICDTEDFSEFYSRLIGCSKIDFNKRIFDKTPRYLLKLREICDKIDVPVYVCFKDPRSIVASDFVRSGEKIFEAWFDGYVEAKKRYLMNLYANYSMAKDCQINNCCLVRLEDMCLNTRETLDRVFFYVNESFNLKYLNFERLRYAHTKEKYIAANIPFVYLKILDKHQILKIEKEFSICDDWFYR